MKSFSRNVFIIFILAGLYFVSTLVSCIMETTEKVTKTVYIVPSWKGSLSSAPDNPCAGDAYYNSTQKMSFIYDGTTWQILSKDGSDGTSIVWKGELSVIPSNP